MQKRFLSLSVFFYFCILSFAATANCETIARCGEGWLEQIDGYPVLHLKGTPYEMGYQHGALLEGIGAREFEERAGEQAVVDDRYRHVQTPAAVDYR